RVGHHAGCRLHVQGAVLDEPRADGDRQVHLAAIADVARRAAVDAASHRLEFVDDLHGANLGCTGQGAGREGGAQHVHGIHALLEQAGDVGYQMHDVRIAFDHHLVGDLDAADLGDAADIIACQVDQHDVFGDLLGVCLELGGK